MVSYLKSLMAVGKRPFSTMLGLRWSLSFSVKGKRLGERLVLEDAAANELAVDLRQHGVRARFQNVDARDFRLLMNLLGLELSVLGRAKRLRLLVRRLQEHLLQHFAWSKSFGLRCSSAMVASVLCCAWSSFASSNFNSGET